jgi:hypothetical protein
LGPTVGFDTSLRRHDALLRVFDRMVQNQLAYVNNASLRPSRYALSRDEERKAKSFFSSPEP